MKDRSRKTAGARYLDSLNAEFDIKEIAAEFRLVFGRAPDADDGTPAEWLLRLYAALPPGGRGARQVKHHPLSHHRG